MWPVVVDRDHSACLLPRLSTCGDAVVDRREECDCGSTYSCDAIDRCCTPLGVLVDPPLNRSSTSTTAAPCRLRPASACSPRVHRCCTPACAVAAAGVTCRRKTDCSSESTCDGRSPSCPAPRFVADGTSCARGRGHCRRAYLLTHFER